MGLQLMAPNWSTLLFGVQLARDYICHLHQLLPMTWLQQTPMEEAPARSRSSTSRRYVETSTSSTEFKAVPAEDRYQQYRI
jgi:hypothetical protein